jgi:hypothetical protein
LNIFILALIFNNFLNSSDIPSNTVVVLFILADTLTLIGTISIAVVVFSVHMHIMKERKIDLQVIKSMRYERVAIMASVGLILLGYVIQLFAYAESAKIGLWSFI